MESRVCWGSDDVITRQRRLESSGPTRRVVEVTPSPLRIRRSDSSDSFSRSDLHRLYACQWHHNAESNCEIQCGENTCCMCMYVLCVVLPGWVAGERGRQRGWQRPYLGWLCSAAGSVSSRPAAVLSQPCPLSGLQPTHSPGRTRSLSSPSLVWRQTRTQTHNIWDVTPLQLCTAVYCNDLLIEWFYIEITQLTVYLSH